MNPTETIEQQKCVPHGTQTLLRCATCDTPVCPKCAVWTEVGQKCPTCGPGSRGPSRRTRVRPVAAMVGGALAVVAGAAYLGSDAFQKSETTPAPVAVAAAMGEEVSDQGLVFVVERFECAVQVLEYDGERASPNGRFCFLALHVRNDGVNDAVFTGEEQFLIDAAGRRFDFDLKATFLYARPTAEALEDDDVFFFSKLGPGEEVEGVLVYDVAETAEIGEVELHAFTLDDLGRIFPASHQGAKVELRTSPATTTTTPPETSPEAPSSPLGRSPG